MMTALRTLFLLLITAMLLVAGNTACAPPTPTPDPDPPPIAGPALILFYTDN